FFRLLFVQGGPQSDGIDRRAPVRQPVKSAPRRHSLVRQLPFLAQVFFPSRSEPSGKPPFSCFLFYQAASDLQLAPGEAHTLEIFTKFARIARTITTPIHLERSKW